MKIVRGAWQIVAKGLLGSERSDENEELARQLQHADDLWPQIIHLADVNFVAPGLWKALGDKGLSSSVPADPAQYLAAVYDMNRTRNAALAEQLDELIRACNAAGIVPGLIKGAAHLKTRLFGDPGLRIMTDLDLIIESAQLDETVKVFDGLGYAPLPDATTDEFDHHHLPAYFRAGDYGSVEVHKEPLNLEAESCLSGDELWQASVDCRDGELQFRVPSPTHSTLLAIVHSEVADKNLKKLFVSLRSLQDVAAMTTAHGNAIDWTWIHQRLRQGGHAGVFRDFLYIFDRLTGTRPLPGVRFGLRPRVRYLACRLALRYKGLHRWMVRFYNLSAYRVGQRFGANQTFLSRNQNRLRVIRSFIARCIGSASNSR